MRFCSASSCSRVSMKQDAGVAAAGRTCKVFARCGIQYGAGAALCGLTADCVGQRHIGTHGFGLVRLLVQRRVRDACAA